MLLHEDSAYLTTASLVIYNKDLYIGILYNLLLIYEDAISNLRPISSSNVKEDNMTSKSSVIFFSLFNLFLKE